MILVVGASGMLGGAIVRRLAERGERIRAVARDASTEKSLRLAGAEPVRGDLKDRSSLEAACRGVATVVTTANSAARGGVDNVETVDLGGNRNLVEAAAEAGVEHFVFVSAQGEDHTSPVPFLRAKGLTSKLLRESGMPYTVLLPDYFMDVWIPLVVLARVESGQPVLIVDGGRRRHYCVAVDDVAGFAVGSVANERAMNRDFLVGGPQALSWAEVISTFERVHGVKLEVHNLEAGAPMPGFPAAVAGFMAALETYDSPPPVSRVEADAVFGVHLTSLESFLRQLPSVEAQPGNLDRRWQRP